MDILIINGSSRKDMNTATLLHEAIKGNEAQGAEAELVHLYDYRYKGCVSCLACKLKNAKTDGLCAVRDDLRHVLERCRKADAILLGTPIYYDSGSGMMRQFIERLLFPLDPYTIDEATGKRNRFLTEVIPVGLIYTMNCPEAWRETVYGYMFRSLEGYISHVLGSCHPLYAAFTYQYKDYSLSDQPFSEEEKRRWRDEHWPQDMQKVYDMGKRLVTKAEKLK